MRVLRLRWTMLTLLAIFTFSGNAAVGDRNVDDLSDAWTNVSTMIKFIGMGELSSTEEAGNRGITSIEKAVDSEKDSDKRSKLRDALGEVRSALSHARKGEWPYAEGAAKRALKLLEDAR